MMKIPLQASICKQLGIDKTNVDNIPKVTNCQITFANVLTEQSAFRIFKLRMLEQRNF